MIKRVAIIIDSLIENYHQKAESDSFSLSDAVIPHMCFYITIFIAPIGATSIKAVIPHLEHLASVGAVGVAPRLKV